MILTEVCVQSTADARAAALGGADRIELCCSLELGGLTPSPGQLESAVDVIATHVLIRPRAGDFCYDGHELRVMAKDIEFAIDRGAAAVVVGALTDAGDVDVAAMVRLLGAAGDTPVTFHRAIDSARDPFAALDTLLELGVSRLLTSGTRPTAPDGVKVIAEFVRRCGDDLMVLPGGGITPSNAAAVVTATGVREIHFSAKRAVPPQWPDRTQTEQAVRLRTDLDVVRATVGAVAGLPVE